MLAGLPPAARDRWDEYISRTVGHEYRSELSRAIATRREARGEARGWARSILIVLKARGIPVPAQTSQQILACTDLDRLQSWLDRASTAATLEDVLHG
ncbi:hypothetical protein O7627_02290 [Solwaraspora sp. WMMD1047]|uniref:hypothetical protein n=1 Tax=Solwaraspora sp. WMMD1047 TaxID=3016102 RepID=UPI0024160F97|nr:hypothetical protein [Solwaraspora sp. WMMD1047]MDG4828133.1 hypothetical protein [Solwaraspora sp. WMMD1047]